MLVASLSVPAVFAQTKTKQTLGLKGIDLREAYKITTMLKLETKKTGEFKAVNPVISDLQDSTQIFAQKDKATESRNFSIHAGLNSDLFDDGFGQSISAHYAYHTAKVLQLECMLFLDNRSGYSFITGTYYGSIAYGLAAGFRINLLPKKNWTPSFAIMPALIYSEQNNQDGKYSSTMPSVCLALSNKFYKKHMVTLGINLGDYVAALHLKYGFWFNVKK
jgi:hypothetical protein